MIKNRHFDSKPPLFVAVFLLALASATSFQGTRGLFDRDETRYAECAREMLLTGSWIVPLRDFKPHLTKPPLTYWAVAVGLKVFGANEWGARMPNALAFSITVLFIGLIGALLFGPDHGALASLIYLSTLVPFTASNIVTTDTILVMWEVTAIWAFLRGERARTPKGAVAWFSLMCIFCGMGFLTKGPAILPVAVAMILYWLLRRDGFKAFPFGPVPSVFFLATGLWWYYTIWYLYPWAGKLILEEQVTGRLFSNVFHRNSSWYAPFYLYLPILTLGAMPWLFNIMKTIYPILRKKPALSQAILSAYSNMRGQPSLLFLALWWSCPLFVFSIAKSRLPLYILPVFAPMAVFFAWRLIEKGADLQGLKNEAMFTLALLVIIKGCLAFVPFPQDARAMYMAFKDPIWPFKEIDTIEGQFLDGLSFYSGKPVEYLPERTTEAKSALADSPWDEEVMEIAKGTPELYVLDLKRGQVDILTSMGLKISPISRFYRYGLFMVSAKPTLKIEDLKGKDKTKGLSQN